MTGRRYLVVHLRVTALDASTKLATRSPPVALCANTPAGASRRCTVQLVHTACTLITQQTSILEVWTCAVVCLTHCPQTEAGSHVFVSLAATLALSATLANKWMSQCSCKCLYLYISSNLSWLLEAHEDYPRVVSVLFTATLRSDN